MKTHLVALSEVFSSENINIHIDLQSIYNLPIIF